MALTKNQVQEELLVDFSKLTPEYAPNELIGRQLYLDIALSAASPADTRLGGRYNRNNPAYLFSGRTGSGRRTLETSIGLMLLDMIIDMGEDESNFRWYLLPDNALDGDNADEICGNINLLFDAVEEDMKNDDYFVQLSLGKLTPVIRKKRAARLFARRLKTVVSSPQSCLVTAACGSDLSPIPEEIRSQFLAMTLTDPDDVQRAEYLSKASEMYPLIKWDMPVQEISEKTEGFTFGMLKNVAGMIFSLAAGMIINRGESVEDYLLITNKAPLSVPADQIEAIISVAAKEKAAAVNPLPLPIVQSIQTIQNASPAEQQAEQPRQENEKQQENHNPDTPSEIESIVQALTMPVMLNH